MLNEILFQENNLKKSPMHLAADLTNILDLTKSEEDLMKAMDSKATRYEIRKAQKAGVKITFSSEEKQLEEFIKLYHETAERQGFIPYSRKYFVNEFALAKKNDNVEIFRADVKNPETGKLENLAFAFIIFYGDEAAYHHGASTDLNRKYSGATLLQWRAILEAKRRGLKSYNFWGLSPKDDKCHRYYGLSKFKRGFGGEDIEYLHAHDIVISKPKYFLNWLLETARRKRRRL